MAHPWKHSESFKFGWGSEQPDLLEDVLAHYKGIGIGDR